MGAPGVPTETELAQLFARARAFAAAVEADEDTELTADLEGLPDHVANRIETVTWAFAQLVVMLAGGLAPVADAVDNLDHAAIGHRVRALQGVLREWYRATDDNSAEAMRLIAKLARKEPS